MTGTTKKVKVLTPIQDLECQVNFFKNKLGAANSSTQKKFIKKWSKSLVRLSAKLEALRSK